MPQSRHLFAKALRNRAEIFADHDAAMGDAFLRGHRQQRLERHLHIDAIGGAEPVRHQIEPLQAQHMVETDGAGVPHRGPQHVAIRRERLQLKSGGIEAGKAPALSGGVERVGRRADAEMARDRRLLVPGIEAVGLHADRDVEIETDLHAELARQIWQAPPSCRSAVHCTNSTNATSSASGPVAQGGASGVVRLPPFLRPFPPRLLEFVPQRLEAGEAQQQRRRARRGSVSKSCRRAGVACALKAANADAERLPFQPGDGDIIDDLACPQRHERVAGRRHRAGIRAACRHRHRAH